MIHYSVGSYSLDLLPPHVQIGNFSSVGEKCYFHTKDNHACIGNRKLVSTSNTWDTVGSGTIVIGNDVWIGYGASILDGVTIGDGAIIGAHSVVSKDVEPFSVVVGNPAQITRYRFTPEQIKKLQTIAWWNWHEDRFTERKKDFEDIDVFIEKYL